MSRSVTLAATAALVAVAIGVFVVGGGPGSVLPSAGPATPSSPAPTLAGGVSLDWTTWQDFTSSQVRLQRPLSDRLDRHAGNPRLVAAGGPRRLERTCLRQVHRRDVRASGRRS